MCRSLFILARHYRPNLKLLIASPASDSKINFVWHCDRFCFCRKPCQTEMMNRIGFFDFFTIEKREHLQHVFLCVALQSTINRISTSAPRSTLHYHFIQTPLLCQHYILMPHTYRYRKHITILQSIINPITRYRSYTKSHFTQHHFHVGFTSHRQHSSVALLPQYCLFRHRSTCG